MKAYYLILLAFVFATISCGNKEKAVEGTDAKTVASGEGQHLAVDLSQSSINWTGSKVGGSHHGTLGLKSGELVVKGDTLVSGNFVLDINNIVDEDLTDAKMNEMLVNHLKSADFFDVANHPEGKFEVTSTEVVTGNDSITHRISGNLTLKGVDKNITFAAKITKDGDLYKAVTLPFVIDRTQWGVNFGSKSVFANLKDKIVDDNIGIQITIVAKAK